MSIGHRELRGAFGAFPTGVVAVAALGPAGPVGLAASSFTSVSLDPPLVSVNLARSSSTLSFLRAQQHWGISVLAEEHSRLCRQLSSRGDRFAGVDWHADARGVVTIEGAAAHFAVRVDSFIPAGDHEIALLEVESFSHDGTTLPLVFHASGLSRTAALPVGAVS